MKNLKNLMFGIGLAGSLALVGCKHSDDVKCNDFIGVVKTQGYFRGQKINFYGIENKDKMIYVYDSYYDKAEDWLFEVGDSVKIKYHDGFLNRKASFSGKKTPIFWMSTYYPHIKILNNKK